MSIHSPPPAQARQLEVRTASIDLVYIPPGTFTMGSTRGLPLELPTRMVAIESPFYMSTFPITQKIWNKVMPANPSRFTDDLALPVDSVSWDDAVQFCTRLSHATGEGVRLPTEAEWEYACRAGTTTEFFFGEAQTPVRDYAWYDMNSRGRTHPVGLKRPNPWGLFDMIGNVWEWCQDVWHNDYNDAPSTGDAWMANADSQPRRSLRGAAWDMDAFRCRSAYRSYDWKDNGLHRFGLRIAVDAQDDK